MALERVVLALALIPGLAFAQPAVAAPTTTETAYRPEVKVTELLRTARNAAGAPLVYPRTDRPEVTGLRVRIPAGAETGWHRHPVVGYAYILSGSLSLQYEGGQILVFKAGQAFVEAAECRHNGRNLGTEDVELVVFFTGEAGAPFTLKTPPPGNDPKPRQD